ncbi:MAG: alanine--tRNA ligase-related protein [Patescibacteria group bacterium]
MTHQEIREKFLKFFEKRGHKIVPSSSLLPTDPSVLFTTAGMQQFKPYYTGEADSMKDFGSLNTTSIQKSMRTSDIDEVGDESHLTFFEMLGNFSFGGYWKKEAIEYAHEFITKEMGLKIDYVSVFKGEDNVPADEESEKIWKSIDPKIEVKKFGRADNFWGPTGDEGPCGPTSEIYVKGIEIWNLVFNQYYQHKDKTLTSLKIQGIDTGMGLERLAMVVQKKNNIFETDLFSEPMELLPLELSEHDKRVVIDHMRASIFLIADGIRPSNKEREYILRRLMRRVITIEEVNHQKGVSIPTYRVINSLISNYQSIYPEIVEKEIVDVWLVEAEKFYKTLRAGIKELTKINIIDAKIAFKLYESFGLPYEAIKEQAEEKSKNLNREAFDEEFKKHQEKSRAGAEKKFGGHGLLLDTGELKAGNEEELKKITRLHTATHLLNQALHNILGDTIRQAGSDITAERTRFDFTFDRKLTAEELKKIENEVNEKIQENLSVQVVEVPKNEAIKGGARSFRPEKYPETVRVYFIGEDSNWHNAYSKELCGGPHVTNTSEIGHFKINKEESISAGTRRIRATIK